MPEYLALAAGDPRGARLSSLAEAPVAGPARLESLAPRRTSIPRPGEHLGLQLAGGLHVGDLGFDIDLVVALRDPLVRDLGAIHVAVIAEVGGLADFLELLLGGLGAVLALHQQAG